MIPAVIICICFKCVHQEVLFRRMGGHAVCVYVSLLTNTKRNPLPFTSRHEEKTQRACSITDSLYPKGPEVDNK